MLLEHSGRAELLLALVARELLFRVLARPGVRTSSGRRLEIQNQHISTTTIGQVERSRDDVMPLKLMWFWQPSGFFLSQRYRIGKGHYWVMLNETCSRGKSGAYRARGPGFSANNKWLISLLGHEAVGKAQGPRLRVLKTGYPREPANFKLSGVSTLR